MSNYDAVMCDAYAQMLPHGALLVDNLGGGDCVLHSLRPHIDGRPPIDAIREKLVELIVRHYPNDVERDRRTGDERSLAAWRRRLLETHAYLPPALSARAFAEHVAPDYTLRLWCVPDTSEQHVGHDARAYSGGTFVLYASDACKEGVRADIELVYIERLRHVVDTRPFVAWRPVLTLKRRALESVPPPPSEREKLAAAIDAYYERHNIAEPRQPTVAGPTLKRARK